MAATARHGRHGPAWPPRPGMAATAAALRARRARPPGRRGCRMPLAVRPRNTRRQTTCQWQSHQVPLTARLPLAATRVPPDSPLPLAARRPATTCRQTAPAATCRGQPQPRAATCRGQPRAAGSPADTVHAPSTPPKTPADAGQPPPTASPPFRGAAPSRAATTQPTPPQPPNGAEVTATRNEHDRRGWRTGNGTGPPLPSNRTQAHLIDLQTRYPPLTHRSVRWSGSAPPGSGSPRRSGGRASRRPRRRTTGAGGRSPATACRRTRTRRTRPARS